MRYYLFLIALILNFYGCRSKEANESKYFITVIADGFPEGTNVSLLISGKNSNFKNNTKIKNGKGLLTGKFESFEIGYINVEGIDEQLAMVIEPENIDIYLNNNSLSKSIVKGGINNDKFKLYNDGLKSLFYEYENLQNQNNTIEIENKIIDIQKQYYEYDFNFLSNNYDSDFALILIEEITNNSFSDVNFISDIIKNIPTAVVGNPVNKPRFETIDGNLKKLLNKKTLNIGDMAPNFSAPDADGKLITLKEILGTVTILDFWASWCYPCRLENPNYVNIYNRYKNMGLVIIGVALERENQKKEWVKAIKDDKLTWYNVSNLKFWDDPIAKLYEIDAIPATFLIDKNGSIIAKNLKGDDLEKKIKSLLSEK